MYVTQHTRRIQQLLAVCKLQYNRVPSNKQNDNRIIASFNLLEKLYQNKLFYNVAVMSVCGDEILSLFHLNNNNFNRSSEVHRQKHKNRIK